MDGQPNGLMGKEGIVLNPLPLPLSENFPIHVIGPGFCPVLWFIRLYISLFLNGKDINAKTGITFTMAMWL